MQIKKQQLESDREQRTGSKLGKEYVKAVHCHPAYLTYMQSSSCEMLGWMKHKLESRLVGKISIASDMQSGKELKNLLMKVKEESEKTGLKLNIQKKKRLWHSGPITSWQMAPRSLQTVTAAIKLRLLLLGRRAMINLDSVLKSRDIILPTKVHIVKATVFPVVMYVCESWTIKKADC